MRFDLYHHNYSGIELDLLKAIHQLLNQMANQIKELSTKVDALKIDKTKTIKKNIMTIPKTGLFIDKAADTEKPATPTVVDGVEVPVEPLKQ